MNGLAAEAYALFDGFNWIAAVDVSVDVGIPPLVALGWVSVLPEEFIEFGLADNFMQIIRQGFSRRLLYLKGATTGRTVGKGTRTQFLYNHSGDTRRRTSESKARRHWRSYHWS